MRTVNKNLGADFVSALCFSSLQYVLTIGRLHSNSKSVGFASFSIVWLEGALHFASSLGLSVNQKGYPKRTHISFFLCTGS